MRTPDSTFISTALRISIYLPFLIYCFPSLSGLYSIHIPDVSQVIIVASFPVPQAIAPYTPVLVHVAKYTPYSIITHALMVSPFAGTIDPVSLAYAYCALYRAIMEYNQKQHLQDHRQSRVSILPSVTECIVTILPMISLKQIHYVPFAIYGIWRFFRAYTLATEYTVSRYPSSTTIIQVGTIEIYMIVDIPLIHCR